MINNKLVESVVKQVILEYGGVSDEVISESDYFYKQLMAQSNRYEWKYNADTSDYWEKKFTIDVSMEDGHIVKGASVKLYGYDGRKHSFREMFDELNERGYINIAFSPSRRIIILKIPFPYDGDIDDYGRDYLISSINHEIKHGLQDLRRGGTNISDAYAKSLSRKTIEDEDSVIYLLKSYTKQLYYLLDLDEVDARLQEIYIQLKSVGDLDKCNSYQKLKEAQKRYVWLHNVLYPINKFEAEFYKEGREQYQKILTEMLGGGITISQFIKYCEKGLQRFNEHLRRIVGRYRNEIGVSNGSFRNYAQNEIPMGEIFRLRKELKKENPSLWRRLMSYLRRN